MEPNVQRLQIAQDLIDALVGFLNSTVRPPRQAVQAAIDAANVKLQALAATSEQPQPPLVAPQVVPVGAIQ